MPTLPTSTPDSLPTAQDFLLVVLYGATAVGKTALAVRLATELGCPVISSDSRQCYREMPIGTAQPTPEELATVLHFFVATHSVRDRFSAGDFELEALKLIEQLRKKTTRAILTGGAMLYIDALLHGIDAFPPPDINLRHQLTSKLKNEGTGALFRELEVLDPKIAQRIDPKNGARVLRALEVCIQTGRPYSSWLTTEKPPRPFRTLAIGIYRNPDELQERIRKRVDDMMAQGLLEEVIALKEYRDLPALKTVGYREIFEYLDGKCDLPTAIENIKIHTRQYARKQMQWWKRDPTIRWFDAEDYTAIRNFVCEALKSE